MRQFRELIPMLPPVSNQATWREDVELKDEDDELIDLTTDVSAITLKLRDEECDAVVLEASLSAGSIVVVGLGVFEFLFSQAAMQELAPKTYEIGLLVTIGGDVEQTILARVPVLKGL